MYQNNFLAFVVSFFLLFNLFSCTSKNQEPNQAANTTASEAQSKTQQKAKVLHLYCWSNYFSPSLIQGFEEKTGVKVDLSFFSSNEELLAKLQAGAQGYDLIVPTGYLVKALKELNLIRPLGKLDWPELKLLNDQAKAPWYDPQHEYVIPYSWGTSGLAINRTKLKTKEVPNSWGWVFDHPELKGKITMLDDANAVLGVALKYLGYSYNEKNPEILAKAKQLLIKQKPLVKAYNSEPQSLLESGEIAIAQFYSGDTLQLKKKNPNIEFIFPKEGGEFFMDNLAIPTNAPSVDLALEFIRYTLDQKRATAQVQHLFYSPVVELKGFLGAVDLLKNETIFPTTETLKKYESIEDQPERLEAVQRIWTELKSL